MVMEVRRVHEFQSCCIARPFSFLFLYKTALLLSETHLPLYIHKVRREIGSAITPLTQRVSF